MPGLPNKTWVIRLIIRRYRNSRKQMNYRFLNLILGILVILPSILTAQMKFKKHDIDVGNGGNVYDLVLEDINADGKMDIVTGHDQRVLWFKNDGAGNFTRYEVTQSNDVSGTRKVFAIDINGDNDIDILSASQSNDRINWYESSGGASPTWTTHMISDSADYAKSVHAADMDADGDIDVFSASTSDGKIAWYESSGGASPTWTEHQVVLGSSADEAVFAAKLTSDNLVDIASGNGDLIIFEKGVSGPTDFSTHVIQTGTTWIQNMTGIDFDGDSDIDIVSANNYSQIYIWENQGFPTNTVHQISLTGGGWYVKAFHPYDIDQQGGIDFIVGPQFHGKKIAILLNKGSYNFDQITIWTSPKEHPYINAVKAANLDPDNGGDTDIDIVAGSQESTHRLFWLEQQIDNTTPTVKFISSEQLNGTYGVGEIIPVEVHFSRSPIDETGTPQLTLNVGGAATKTINRTSIKDSIMTFHYTVEAGHNSPGLDIASTTALTGTIKSFGSEVDLTLPAPGHANSLAGKKALVIDTTVPAVTNVSSTKLDGTYGPGELIPVTVEFDNNVTVMGPLTLDANWTTNSGHVSGTTHWQSFTAENSGKIRIIDLELQSPLGNNQAYSRSATGTLKIYQGEGNSGTELHSQPVTFLNKDNTWKTYVLSSPVTVTSGQQYTWEVNTAESERSWVRYFNSNAYAGGKSSNSNDREFLFKVYVEETAPDLKLTLDTGTTPNAVIDYASGTGTNTLTFNYTVAADHSSSDLDYENSSSLVLNSGTVKDAGENDASFVLANPGDPESLGANKNINLDTDPPTVTFDPANGVTGVDLDKAVTITFSHDVRKIDDTPITNVDVATMFEFKQDDASGAPAATGVNATWDGVNNRITINHDNFPSIQVVYVAIKANMVEDDYNNPVAAENITFTVKDAAAPTVTFNPGDLETGVSLASDITITFNEAVRKTDDSALDDTNVDGHITLKEDDASGADIPFDATIDAATNVITVDPDTDFEGEKSIYACIDDQIEDFSDNAIPQTCVTFDTEDVSPPVVTLSPSNGEADVPIASGLIISLSEPVRKTDDSALDDTNVDALITLKIDDINGASLPFDAEVKLSRKKITVAPDNNFTSEQVIYYCIDPVEDESGNATSQTCATFTAEDIAAPTITIDPADLAIDVPVEKIIKLTSSEALRRVDDDPLDDTNIDNFITLKENSSSGPNILFDATIHVNEDTIYVDPTNNLKSKSQVYVAIWAGVEDYDDNAINPENSTFTTADAESPTVTFDPADSVTDVVVSKTIKLTFSEAIRDTADTALTDTNVDGHITLKKNDASGNNISFDATIDAAKKVITVDPTNDFDSEQKVYVAINDKVVEDDADNAVDLASAIFTVEDILGPSVTFFPVDNAPNVPINTVPTITFSEPVLNTDATDVTDANVEALITFKEGTDATGADIALGSVTINAAKTVITLQPDANFASEIDVFMCVDPVEDEHGNESIQQCATFKTSDVIAPVVTWDPVNGSTDVAIAKTISLAFDDPVRKADDDSELTNLNVGGLITLKLNDANGVAVPFGATVSATMDTIYVDPTALLGSKTTYYAAIGATVEDNKNNAILASSSTFITVDSEAPAVAFSPIDGATNITVDTTIVLTFSEPVRLVNDDAMTNANIEPLIALEKVLASGLEKVNIDAAVSTDNIKVTLTPQALLLSEQLYKISIGATVEDFSNNAIVAASAQFTTEDAKPPTVTFNPADGDTGVSVTTDIKIIFNESVRLLDNSDLTNDNVDTLIVFKDTDHNGADIPFDATVNTPKTEITVNPNSNFSTRQTVYVGIKAKVEDDVDNAINAASAIFSMEETPEIIISQPSVSYTTEAGGKTTFTLTLGKEPTSNVIVDIKSKDESEGKASESTITFSTTFWTEIEEVEIVGQNDDIDDGDVPYEIEISGVVSDDDRYNGIDPDDVQLVNKDDSDKAGFTLSPAGGLVTTEAGEKDSFSVKLNSEPIAKLTIPLEKSKEKEGSLSADSLVFTSANWGTFQKVMVTGLNDSIIDGDRTYKILTRKPVSDDSLYASLDPDDIIVTNRAREPIMSVSVDSLDFGRVFRDSYSVKGFDVINSGTDTLRFFNAKVDTSAFNAGASEFKVAPRDTIRVGIQFVPEEPFVYEGEYTAKHNDFSKGDLKIKLKGEALKPTIAIVDSIVDFGNVHVFFDELMKLRIYNKGNSDLRIDSLVVTGEQFSTPLFESTYLKPADTSKVIVRISSPNTGKAIGNVRIFSSDQDNPRLDIPIQATILPPDTLGPSFDEIIMTPEKLRLREVVTIDATLGDATRVDEVMFHILEGGKTNFKTYTMITEDEKNFEFVSQPGDVNLNGVAFFMSATDIRGNVAISDTLSPPVKFLGGSLQTTQPTSAYGDGLPKKKWRLISVPAKLEDPNVENILSDDFGGHSKSNTWLIFEPNQGSGGSKWKKPKQFSSGKGYWLIQTVKKNAAFSTGSGETISLKGFNLTLDPGWNMISSPYAFPVTPNLDATDFYGPLTYGIENEGWSEEMTMLPFGGYLIYNRLNSAKTVRLEPLDFSPMTNTRTLARENSDGEWKLQLNAEGENYSDIGNIIGRLSDAEEGIDHFDNPEPPYLDKYVSVTFEIDNPSTRLHSMNSDIRSIFERDGVWNVTVQAKGEKGPITLSYDLEGHFPGEDAMIMLDMSSREQYNLLDDQTIEITEYSENFPYRFKIFAGSPEYVASAMADALSLLPDEFTLRQNYPNPFNPSTTIEFTLPQPTEVSLIIYNLMGQEVRTLERGMMDTGHHSILWHGKDNRGQLVSSGVYFIRFYSPEFTASHKMVLMK